MLTKAPNLSLGEQVLVAASETCYQRDGKGRIPYGTRISCDLFYRFKSACNHHDVPMSRVLEELIREFVSEVDYPLK